MTVSALAAPVLDELCAELARAFPLAGQGHLFELDLSRDEPLCPDEHGNVWLHLSHRQDGVFELKRPRTADDFARAFLAPSRMGRVLQA